LKGQKPTRPREGLRHVVGRGIFVDDIKLNDTYYMAVYRSPYAHARLVKVEVSEVMKHQDAALVITPDTVKRFSKPLRTRLAYPRLKMWEHYSLAFDKVRYFGEPIVAVVARDRYVAKDLLELVEVDYEPLPAVVDVEEAVKKDAPLLYEEWGDNIAFIDRFGAGNIESAFCEADEIIEEKIREHRYTGTPLEPRAYLACYDKLMKRLTFYSSTQNPHITRTLLANILSIPENSIRVVMPDVGGAFGLKHPLYPEEVLTCIASIILGKPVKYVEERSEHMKATHHAREQIHYVKTAVKRDGAILAVKDKILVDLGVATPSAGPYSAYVTARYLTGPYRIRNYEYELIGVVTNKTTYGAYRGFGKADSNYVMERIIDIIASELGMDPAEVRIRNLVDRGEMPYRSVTGAYYDGGDYRRCLNRLLDIIDYWKLRKIQEEESRGVIGIGLAFVIEPSAVSIPNSFLLNYDSVVVRVSPSGKVSVAAGAAPQGQMYETVISQLVADILSIPAEDVTVLLGDTDQTPYGLGSYSSRFAPVIAPAVVKVTKKIRERIVKAASTLLDEPAENLTLEDGHVVSRLTGNKIPIHEVARILYVSPEEAGVEQPGLEEVLYFKAEHDFQPDRDGRVNPYLTYPYAAAAAVVEIDAETGYVKLVKLAMLHDCGEVLNEEIVEGQVIGGLAQGIGGIMYEELVYDEAGNLLTSSFMDYLIPSAAEMPRKIITERMTTPSLFVEGGYKGVGEIGAIASPPALVNAVADALSRIKKRRIKIKRTPLKPCNVWDAIRSCGSS